jgi:hypothetical protein
MIEIPLTRGKVAKIDDQDFHLIGRFKWHVRSAPRTLYAVRGLPTVGAGTRKKVSMHSAIFGAVPVGFVCDHIDGDGLNNQRANLRIATPRLNNVNRFMPKLGAVSATKFRGVRKRGRKFLARIKDGGAWAFGLGTFFTPEEAAYAYDLAAARRFGEFAVLNFNGGMG